MKSQNGNISPSNIVSNQRPDVANRLEEHRKDIEQRRQENLTSLVNQQNGGGDNVTPGGAK